MVVLKLGSIEVVSNVLKVVGFVVGSGFIISNIVVFNSLFLVIIVFLKLVFWVDIVSKFVK